jgi:hypothetical protein
MADDKPVEKRARGIRQKPNVKHEADKRARSSKWKALAVHIEDYELWQTVTLSFACPIKHSGRSGKHD